MNAAEIANSLQSQFGDRIIAAFANDKHPRVHIHSADWRVVAEHLRHDTALRFDWLANLSGLDYVADGKMACVYDLWSFDLKHAFAVKVFTPREKPSIVSVADLWPAADWHEREAFDLFGINFPGHPDLRRILCADDWVGHPLRKDYEFPREYHGIPGGVGAEWEKQK